MQTRSSKSNKFRRDAWLEINLDSLEHNLNQIHESVKTPLMPIVKADGYGHGATIISPILEAYDFVESFGVASMDEAISLREAGIKKDILVLGITPQWAYEAALNNDISLTVVDIDSSQALNDLASSLGKKAKVHVKFDTGLNRIGFKEEKLKELLGLYEANELASLDIQYIFSHFADIADASFSKSQLQSFEAIASLASKLNIKSHIASSSIARALPESRKDLVRCGIELYGYKSDSFANDSIELKPLLSLYARINFLKEIKSGETVSYLRKWKAEKDSKIATLPLGYADGVSRALSNKMQGFYHGQVINQVGVVTMDQLMFNVTELSDIKSGEIIELIGPNMPMIKWTEALDTISYEVATNLSIRLPKIYTRPKDDSSN